MDPGVLAVSWREGYAAREHVRSVLAAAGVTSPVLHEGPGLVVATWGGLDLDADGAVMLTRTTRRRESDVGPAHVAGLMAAEDVSALRQMLPPFAAFQRQGRAGAMAVTDALGFRHVYCSLGPDWAALSTSARVLGVLGGHGLDHDALSLQSLLGWQVGQWTLFEGVTKLAPGALARIRAGSLEVSTDQPPAPPLLDLDTAVDEAAQLLRDYLTAYVTEHPDATIQLTGGADSRILMSAVPPELRRSLTAVTLRVPGSQDVDVAAAICARTGTTHRVEAEALADLEYLTPAQAYAECAEASLRLEGMADPVALAALTMVERRLDQGHRISGLGGEVARGFYYFGRSRDLEVTRGRVARLASWRMFANEAADQAALHPSLREGARDRAVDRIHRLMADTGKDWLRATDDFYLEQRMQRWAGVTETAVCLNRSVVNPMLDDRFIAIAQGMAPASKRRSLFLARLQMALDPELGRMPLENRPPPEAYAHPGPANRVRSIHTFAGKAGRKARQRLGHSTRPPAGGDVLAAKVVDHWRLHPELLDPARDRGVLDPAWLDHVVRGVVDPAPSSVAFVLNASLLPDVRRSPVAG